MLVEIELRLLKWCYELLFFLLNVKDDLSLFLGNGALDRVSVKGEVDLIIFLILERVLAPDVAEHLVFADVLHLGPTEAADGDSPCFERVLQHYLNLGNLNYRLRRITTSKFQIKKFTCIT